jgi:hypothetical protein
VSAIMIDQMHSTPACVYVRVLCACACANNSVYLRQPAHWRLFVGRERGVHCGAVVEQIRTAMSVPVPCW